MVELADDPFLLYLIDIAILEVKARADKLSLQTLDPPAVAAGRPRIRVLNALRGAVRPILAFLPLGCRSFRARCANAPFARCLFHSEPGITGRGF